MKLEFKLKNSAQALKSLKKARPKEVLFAVDSTLLASAEGLAVLRLAADFCIERGAGLRIEGVSPCFMPGYSRYLLPAGTGALACPEKERCFLGGVCSGIPAKHAGIAGAFKPPPRIFTDLEKCMLAILARKNGITTAQVLKAAKGIKICACCSKEGEVFRAAERLVKFGLVSKKYNRGVYIWEKI
ncbi:MAG: hypothetical protein A2X34_07205 [Elusimicrobia bacterium GWC2_51_8]|nr:MAG: hypothetical protein A2X34_07205 [Elusimicrobia bacterium GWC2_51_8]